MLSIEVIHMASPLLDKSLEFATQIVLFYEAFSKTRKDTTITKQLLRSATSIGAIFGTSNTTTYVEEVMKALADNGANTEDTGRFQTE